MTTQTQTIGRTARNILTIGVAAAAFGPLAASAHAANPATGNTASGPFEIVIDSPVAGSNVALGELTMKGRVGVPPLGVQASAVYVVDHSGSTANRAGDCNGDSVEDTGDDFNADGRSGTVMDCEIAGTLALNRSLFATNVQSALVKFDSSASTVQDFVNPSGDTDGNGTPDIEQAARTLKSAGGTDFDAALTESNRLLATRTGKRVVFFLSDGIGDLTTGAGSALQEAKDTGIIVNTYAVGTGAAGCGSSSRLQTIADATGGVCTNVTDPTKLQTAITTTAPAGIDRVEVTANNGAPAVAPVDGVGGYAAKVTIKPGVNILKATVFAKGGGSVTADITVNGPVAKRLTHLDAAPVVLGLNVPGLLTLGSISAKLTVDGGAPVTGKAISFRANNGTLVCTAVTAATGVAKCNGLAKSTAALLGLGYRATFAGDDAFAASTATGTLIR